MSKIYNERIATVSDLQTLSVDITDYSNSASQAKVVYYTIVATIKLQGSSKPFSWKLTKRFSEFVALNSTLSKFLSVLPDFPTKAVVPSWLMLPSLDKLDKRKKALQKYMQEIVKIPAVVRSKDFHEFFGFDTVNIRLVDNAHPNLMFSLNDPRFGINSIEFDVDNNLLISACEDPNIVSRMNSYITNTKMPWESHATQEIPIGVLNIWQKDSKGDWDVAAFTEYTCQCTAVCWDAPRNRVFVGLETGIIKIYKLDSPFNHLRFIQDVPAHEARVSEIIYDPEKDVLMSCSRDKSVCMYNVGQDSIMSSLKISETWLMSMAFDQGNQRLFVGAYSGAITIIDIRKGRLKPVHTLTDHKDCVRTLSYHPGQRYLFSGCFDSKSYIWTIGHAGHEHSRSRAVACLRGGPKSKVKAILFCPANRLVITGHNNGMMAFWSTATAKVEFVVNRHDSSIVVLKWIESERILLSGSRDGNIRFWKFQEGVEKEVESVQEVKAVEAKVEPVKPRRAVSPTPEKIEAVEEKESVERVSEYESEPESDHDVEEVSHEESDDAETEQYHEASEEEQVEPVSEKLVQISLDDETSEPVSKPKKQQPKKPKNPFAEDDDDDLFS